MTLSDKKKIHEIIDIQWNFEEGMSKWIVRVTVDGLAPLGVKASLGTMMISHTDACWLITRNGYIHIIKQRIYAHHIHVTVRWCYNAANFLTNPYNRHPIADREGEIWGVFCEFKSGLCSAGWSWRCHNSTRLFKFKVQITLLLYETSNSLQLQNALHMELNTEWRFIQHSSTKQ